MAERLPRAGRSHPTSQEAALVSCNAMLGGVGGGRGDYWAESSRSCSSSVFRTHVPCPLDSTYVPRRPHPSTPYVAPYPYGFPDLSSVSVSWSFGHLKSNAARALSESVSAPHPATTHIAGTRTERTDLRIDPSGECESTCVGALASRVRPTDRRSGASASPNLAGCYHPSGARLAKEPSNDGWSVCRARDGATPPIRRPRSSAATPC